MLGIDRSNRRGLRYSLLPFLAVLGYGLTSMPCRAQSKGVALVLGNSGYSDGQPEVSGKADAEAMAASLAKLQFTVMGGPQVDRNFQQTSTLIDDFIAAAKTAPSAVFFYSGHGFQVNLRNYLMPIGSSVNAEKSIDISRLIQRLDAEAPAIPKFVFLDACRKETVLPPKVLAGFAPVDSVPASLVAAFATGPGQVAESGLAEKVSPYAEALSRQLLVPGLSVQELLGRVTFDVASPSSRGQRPTESDLSSIPTSFFFSDPVVIQGVAGSDGKLPDEQRSDELIVVVNGNIVKMERTPSGSALGPIPLRAGENSLLLLVADQKDFTGTHSWETTEGWEYKFQLIGPGGTPLLRKGCASTEWCFQGKEPTPFKDGPHHGRTFEAARATIFVDPTGEGVSLTDLHADVWRTEAPLYARDQEPLFEIALSQLPIDSRPGLKKYFKLVEFARKALEGLSLKDSVRFPDLDKVFAQVWGNEVFRRAVTTCMTGVQEGQRLADAEVSVANALRGEPRPFASFDASLTRCIQEQKPEDQGKEVPVADVKVWTSFHEERSDETAPSGQPQP